MLVVGAEKGAPSLVSASQHICVSPLPFYQVSLQGPWERHRSCRGQARDLKKGRQFSTRKSVCAFIFCPKEVTFPCSLWSCSGEKRCVVVGLLCGTVILWSERRGGKWVCSQIESWNVCRPGCRKIGKEDYTFTWGRFYQSVRILPSLPSFTSPPSLFSVSRKKKLRLAAYVFCQFRV